MNSANVHQLTRINDDERIGRNEMGTCHEHSFDLLVIVSQHLRWYHNNITNMHTAKITSENCMRQQSHRESIPLHSHIPRQLQNAMQEIGLQSPETTTTANHFIPIIVPVLRQIMKLRKVISYCLRWCPQIMIAADQNRMQTHWLTHYGI